MVTGFSIGITQNSQNAESNTSNVTVGLTISWNGGSYNATGNASGTLTIDGASYPFTATFNTGRKSSGSEVIYTQTLNIPHTNDGTKTLSCSASFATGTAVGTVTASATKALTAIARESTIGATDANIGSVSLLSVNRKNSAYTHSIAYQFGQASGYLADPDGTLSATEAKLTAVSLAFPSPESFYSQIPNSPSGVCTLTVKTYSGATQIGTAKTCRFTVTAAENLCRPAVSGSVVDINERTLACTGDENTLVRGMSTALCTVSAQVKNGATLKAKTIAGEQVQDATRIIEAFQQQAVVFTATDSRLYTTSYTVEPNMIDYVNLTCNISATRTDPTSGNGTLTVRGNYFNGSFGAEENALYIYYQIEDGEQVPIEPQINGDAYVAVVQLSDLDYQRAHKITVYAEDKLMGATKTATVKKGIPVFDWGENDMSIHVPLTVMGEPLNHMISSLEALDAFVFSDGKLHIGYGIIQNEGYLSVNVGWITMQFKVVAGNNILKRVKYGGNAWGNWAMI